MSHGDGIQIDEDELGTVIAAIQTGKIAKVRQGIFNPSFYTSIVLDRKRIKAYQDDNQYRQPGEIQPIGNLPDIFAGRLGEQETKRLSGKSG